MDEALKVKLLREIAVSFSYSYEQVRSVYATVKSIDATIKICEAAATGGFSSPAFFADIARDGLPERLDVPRLPRILTGPSETKDDLPDTLLGHPVEYTSDLKLGGFEIKFGPFEFYGPEEDAINKT